MVAKKKTKKASKTSAKSSNQKDAKKLTRSVNSKNRSSHPEQTLSDVTDKAVEGPKPQKKVRPKPSKPKKTTAKKSKKTEASESDQPKNTQHHFILRETQDPKAHWYVIHTYSGHEAKVAHTLIQRIKTMKIEDKVFEILIPTQDKIMIKQGQKNKVKEQIFPGYMLVKMELTDQSWLTVRTTPGVTSFVGTGNKPTPLSPEEVQSILKFVAQAAPKFKSNYSTGEAVKIVDGPFSDFLGQIDEIDEARGKVRVLVSIFGRETPVELDFLQIAKA